VKEDEKRKLCKMTLGDKKTRGGGGSSQTKKRGERTEKKPCLHPQALLHILSKGEMTPRVAFRGNTVKQEE